MIRTTIANTLLDTAILIGETVGLERKVTLSQHSIEIELDHPETDSKAWDDSLYKRGNVFVDGYANPIKAHVEYREDLENPNTIAVTEGNEDADTDDDNSHINLISSSRYRDYMRQDLISQLLTPREQWKTIAWVVGGLAVVMVINLLVSLSAAGAF